MAVICCGPGFVWSDNVAVATPEPSVTPVAMDEQLRFAIREGGRTVGAGVVTKILA